MKTVAVIQARMGSTRLPNKVLADLGGSPMLAQVAARVRQARTVDEVVVATSTASQDDAVEVFCASQGISCFRGSENDVLDRYYQAARAFAADVVVRISADCPLHDPRVIDAVVSRFDPARADYVSNTVERTYPDGLDTEVFSFAVLERAWREAAWTSEREHVTPYIWKHPELFRIEQVKQSADLSALRWTVDEPRDLALVREVYRRLAGRDFTMNDVASLVADDDLLRTVNAGIPSNEGYEISVRSDRIVGTRERR
jgi:spore coat polysaccharide biosynthesis protein SpsF (cytidylyltransferase family)